MELISYIDIVTEFYKKFGGASLDNGGAYRISVQGAPVVFLVDGLAKYLGIPKLRNTYPNMLPREFDPLGDKRTTQDKGVVYIDEVDTLTDHEVRDLIVGPMYDRMKSIR